MTEPIYKQIENYILELIRTNQIKRGEFIPSEKQLSEEFNVTRMTVRSALNNLVRDGYISRQRGVGSKVITNDITDNISNVTGFTKEMCLKGYEVDNIVLSFTIVEASEDLAKNLAIGLGDNVWEIKRVRLANQERVSYMETYMPVQLFPNLKKSHCEGSLYSYIENDCGYKISTSNRSVKAIISDEELMDILALNEVEPLLYIRQIAKLTNGEVFEYSHTYHLGYTLTLNATSE